MTVASRFGTAVLTTVLLIAPRTTAMTIACQQPDATSVAGAFDLAANGVIQAGGAHQTTVPPSLLAAIGWVESNWQQLNARNTPLISPDFGYGIMQITSGMAGAFGQASGAISPDVQSRIASDYQFNIAYGARVLADKLALTPTIGTGDPTAIETWYYAVWAYNGWGWVNNPNNPRFQRSGTPASNPATWPYQERVLYLVAHPPIDRQGNPLWQPIAVSLPSRATIGKKPGQYTPNHIHHQAVAGLSAIYFPGKLSPATPATTIRHSVRLLNTGTQPWVSVGSNAVSLTYHVFDLTGNTFKPFTPFSTGVVAYGQHPVPIPKDVLPGQSVTVAETLQAPAHLGTYRVVWDLEEGSGVWFSQLLSLPRVTQWKVQTVPSGPPPPPLVTPTPVPQVAENLAFLADSATSDHTVVGTAAAFQKGWLIFNTGSVAWGKSWRLVRISGKAMGPSSIPVPPTAPCFSANVLASLTAPARAGTYRSTWRLRDPGGRLVGQRLTVVIQAVAGGPRPGKTPTATPTPTAIHHPGPTPSATPVG